MVRMICPECGKRSSDDIDDSGICQSCDKKLFRDPKQTTLADFYDHIAHPQDVQSDTSLEVIKE